MAKKKAKSNLGKICGFIAAVLGIIAICMIFVDTIKVPDTEILGKVVEGEGYTGLEVAFGYKAKDVTIFTFSIMALLPYLLMIGGVILSFLNLTSKKSSKGLDFITVVLFAVAGVFCFLMPSLVAFADTIAGKVAAEIDYTLAIGAIVSAITSIGAAAFVLFKVIKQK